MIILSGLWFVISWLSDLLSIPFYWIGEGLLWLLNKIIEFGVKIMQTNGTLGLFLFILFIAAIWGLWELLLFAPWIALVIFFIPILSVFSKITGATIMLILIYMAYLKIRQWIKLSVIQNKAQ